VYEVCWAAYKAECFVTVEKGSLVVQDSPVNCSTFPPIIPGADPGFFVGGGAPLRNGITDW